jgi:hypothetical protein
MKKILNFSIGNITTREIFEFLFGIGILYIIIIDIFAIFIPAQIINNKNLPFGSFLSGSIHSLTVLIPLYLFKIFAKIVILKILCELLYKIYVAIDTYIKKESKL